MNKCSFKILYETLSCYVINLLTVYVVIHINLPRIQVMVTISACACSLHQTQKDDRHGLEATSVHALIIEQFISSVGAIEAPITLLWIQEPAANFAKVSSLCITIRLGKLDSLFLISLFLTKDAGWWLFFIALLLLLLLLKTGTNFSAFVNIAKFYSR